jgi:hypothetical protein
LITGTTGEPLLRESGTTTPENEDAEDLESDRRSKRVPNIGYERFVKALRRRGKV